ncbi:hypothetical protein [Zobellia laminariae]|uniref:hypothetical protein n=1 Tax=Zobellia laminariae TaxID=248906 RepID=UPI0026F429B9|nr:hypothetical protein [Zobellia laminariae]WKX76138.1 hypothetical protein Q5W13_21630 [Zobellia laminariae]
MNKQKVVVVITVCLGLLILMLCYKYKTKSISKNGIRTIGRVTGFDGGHKTSGPSIMYTYNVNNKKYKGGKYIEDVSIHKSSFYVVQYSSEKPSWSEILLNQPVTDTIKIKKAGFSLPKKKKNRFQEF